MRRRYRKRPIEVDAIQWAGDWSAIIDWLESLRGDHALLVPFGQRPGIVRDGDQLILTTIHEDPAICRLGDWVVPEPAPNRFYPVENDTFALTYEPVEEAQEIELGIPLTQPERTDKNEGTRWPATP